MEKTNNRTQLTGLKINNIIEPQMLDDSHPSFRWQMLTDRYGAEQKAYQIYTCLVTSPFKPARSSGSIILSR